MLTLESILSLSSGKSKPETARFLQHLGCPVSETDADLERAQALWNELKRKAFRIRWLAPYESAVAEQNMLGPELSRLERRYSAAIAPSTSEPPDPQWSQLPATARLPATKYKLSIVAVSRNDNHGGHLQPRMQAFLDNLIRQSEHYRCPVEIIIVEWNPPAQAERFRTLLRYPDRAPYTTVRLIEVTPERHRRFHYAESQALYQMIGKNVGIRRAEGDYILCTNVDILFSDELFEHLATTEFDRGAIYRCDRHDAAQLTSYDGPDALDLLEYCSANTLRRNSLKGTYTPDGAKVNVTYPENGDTDHLPFPMLHTNGCGDFQLMDRSLWYQIGGYAEFDCFSLHIDSVLQITAHFAGIKEIRLQAPLVCYHIDHDSGWSPQSEAEGTLDASLKSRKLPRLEYSWILELAHTMRAKGSALSLNQPDWGMAGETLPEDTICQSSEFYSPPANGESSCAKPGIDYLQNSQQLIVTDHELPPERIQIEFSRQHFDHLSGLIAELSRGRELLLWGAGARGKLLSEALEKSGRRVMGFIDSNPQLANTLAHGLPVKAPAAIANRIGDVFILIASMQSDEIQDQLKRLGFTQLQDFFDPIF